MLTGHLLKSHERQKQNKLTVTQTYNTRKQLQETWMTGIPLVLWESRRDGNRHCGAPAGTEWKLWDSHKTGNKYCRLLWGCQRNVGMKTHFYCNIAVSTVAEKNPSAMSFESNSHNIVK